MTDNTHGEMREGHHKARLEHLTWLDEIRQWRLDHRRALIRIQALIELHEAELDAAAEAIEDHEIRIEEHDGSIMAHEAGGEGEDHESLLTLHNAADGRHGKMADSHAAMKKKHEAFMEAVRHLLDSVGD